MPSRLQKAKQDPESMKGRILKTARKLFGDYGYDATTTRMIAKEVGIDISTLYYHWGEKQDLYEAVILDINDEIQERFREIELRVKGQSLDIRLDIAIDVMADYLFENPEVSNLMLLGYFSKDRHGITLDSRMADHIASIAVAMGLSSDKRNVSVQAKARIMAVWNSVLNFISGENFFRPMMDVDHETYRQVVKETLKFILVPAFVK